MDRSGAGAGTTAPGSANAAAAGSGAASARGAHPASSSPAEGDDSHRDEEGREITHQDDDSVETMLRAAVDGVLSQNPAAREAYEALLDRGLERDEARGEIARVLLGVMAHVRDQTERLGDAGGGAELRRRAFRRLAAGESAREIFG